METGILNSLRRSEYGPPVQTHHTEANVSVQKKKKTAYRPSDAYLTQKSKFTVSNYEELYINDGSNFLTSGIKRGTILCIMYSKYNFFPNEGHILDKLKDAYTLPPTTALKHLSFRHITPAVTDILPELNKPCYDRIMMARTVYFIILSRGWRGAVFRSKPASYIRERQPAQ